MARPTGAGEDRRTLKGRPMKIMVVCGAGASSTFVALRMRRSAAGRDLAVEISAGTEVQLPAELDRPDDERLDVVLVGPHLASRYAALRESALANKVGIALLPATVFAARDGDLALDLALASAWSTP